MQSKILQQRFIHLRVRTEYSLLNSALRIKDIASHIKKISIPPSDEEKESNVTSLKPLALGMMDDFSMSGAFSFSSKIGELKVKPLLGTNVCIINRFTNGEPGSYIPYASRNSTLGLLAINKQGYQNIILLLQKSQFRGSTKDGVHYITLDELAELNEGIICLTGGYHGIVAGTFINGFEEEAIDLLRLLQQTFGNRLYIELTRHGRTNEQQIEDFLIKMAYQLNVPLVATNDVHFLEKRQFTAHDAITCIRDQTFVIEADRRKLNAEYYLKSEAEMIELFADIPEAIENTVQIAKRCSFFVQKHQPMLPSFAASPSEEIEIFDRMCLEGLAKRRKEAKEKLDEEYDKRLEYEAGIIKQMGFVGYFLIVCDFIKWAKLNGIPVGPGRGSGAGSIIAWCLEITNVNPIKYGLIFERFLNPERVSMPDFDVDFCQSRRDEVIEYVRNKYGHDRVASIITFGTLQAKAALKDVGRVLSIPYNKTDEICKLIPFNPIEPVTLSKALEIDDALRVESTKDDEIKELVEIALEVEGMFRHSSTHAAGIVIAGVPLTEIAPVNKDLTSDLSVVGFNMKDAEATGLVKFDFLGLKTLTVIADTVKLIKQNRNIDLNIDAIDLEDPKTLALLSSGKTKGIFQFEATVPREALQQINVNGVPDLSSITSLNRPGPIDNLPSFLQRKNSREAIIYPHELLKDVLEETYGVIIYQEQVMKAAQVLAGYSLGGADLLRRAMGKKILSEMNAQRATFVKGCVANNITEEKASELFDTIEKFAGYGFNKSHAVAYSVITYQTAYLKAHFQEEFFTSALNLEITNTDKLVETINDCRISGIKIEMPDINESDATFTVKSTGTIAYALGALKSISVNTMVEALAERSQNGPFTSIFNFIQRCGHLINKRTIENLCLAGAFDKLHPNRIQLKNSIDVLAKYCIDLHSKSKTVAKTQVSLFGEEEDKKTTVPEPSLSIATDPTLTDLMEMEFASFGFYMSTNPLFSYREQLKKYGIVESADLEAILKARGSIDLLMAGVVTKVTQRFSKKGRFAFVTVADASGMASYAVFNDGLITHRRDLLSEGQVILVELSARVDDVVGVRLTLNEIADCRKILESIELLNSKNATIVKGIVTHFAISSPGNTCKIKQSDNSEITINLGSLTTQNGKEIIAKVNNLLEASEIFDKADLDKHLNMLTTMIEKAQKANSRERSGSRFVKQTPSTEAANVTTETRSKAQQSRTKLPSTVNKIIVLHIRNPTTLQLIETALVNDQEKPLERICQVVINNGFKKIPLNLCGSIDFIGIAEELCMIETIPLNI